MRRALPVMLVICLAACHSSLPSERVLNTVDGAIVNSFASTPLRRHTASLDLRWDWLGKPGQLAITDVLSYGGAKPAITAPAGWKLIRDDSTGSVRQSLYWHVLQPGDPTMQTWLFSEPVDAQGAGLVLDKAAAGNPIDASTGSTGGGFHLAAEPVTTTDDGDLILAFYASDFPGTAPGHDTPANTGLIADQTDVHPYWILGTYQSGRGKTEEKRCQAGQVFNWTAAQVAIRRRT